jgi:hypothetical protein
MGRLLIPLAHSGLLLAPGNGLLTDYWRDILNGASCCIGVISLLTSIFGLIYSVLSWKAAGKARTAAEAAKTAAEDARAESRRRFEAFAAGKLREFVQRASDFLHRREWGKAALLLTELGEQAGHFAVQDATWKQPAEDLRKMATNCTAWEVNGRTKGHPPKWNLLLDDVLAKLPAYHTPI